MKIIKKLLIGAPALALPFATIACSKTEDTDNIQKKFGNLLDEGIKIYWKFSSHFDKISKEGYLKVSTTPENQTKIEEKNGYLYTYKFFDHITKPVYNKYGLKLVKISTKEEFENLIIKRYQDLHTLEDYKPTSGQVISAFEKAFLNYANVYQQLENNDIYILTAGISGTFSEIVIPFVSDNTVELKIINNHLTLTVDERVFTEQLWKVFTLPKREKFTLSMTPDFSFGSTNLDKLQEEVNILKSYYNNEFQKSYKKE